MATFLVGTRRGLLLVRLDPGATMASEPRRVLEGRVDALSADGGTQYALLDGARVHRFAPDRWVPVAQAPRLTALAVARGVVFAGTADGRVLRQDAQALVPLAGFDALDRSGWHAVGSDAPYVRSLTATAGGDVLLANVHVGGVARSADRGDAWTVTVPPDDDVHEVRAHPERAGVVVLAAAVGFASSDDGGLTWTRSNDGLHARYARAVAFAGDTVLLSASDGPFSRRGALYRRPAGATTFERCTVGLPAWFPGNIDTGCVAGRGDVVVIGDSEGNLFCSRDAGRSFARAASGLPSITAVAVQSAA